MKATSGKLKLNLSPVNPLRRKYQRIFCRRKANYPGKPEDTVRNKEQWKVKLMNVSKLYALYVRISCTIQKYIKLKPYRVV